MKQIKIRLHIKYILFIISYLKLYINCAFDCKVDCKRVGNECVYENNYLTGDECSKNCRPNLYNKGSEQCYSCSDNNRPYYYFPNDISETCYGLDQLCKNLNVHKKNIYGTDQCVSSCGSNYYEMGIYCFSDCNGGNREMADSSNKKCKCRYLYYIKSDNEYICLDQNKYCESYHKSYDYDTKECSSNSNCGDKKTFRFHREGYVEDFLRCSSSCLKDEYLNETSNECVNDCKDYFIEENKCVKDCKPNWIKEGKKCLNKDDCKYINHNINTISAKCLDSCSNYITSIDNSQYKYCSTECQNPTPYLSGVSGDNVCIKDCPNKFYKTINGIKTCVDATEAQKCYYNQGTDNNKKCLDKCTDNGFKYNIVGSHECINNCGSTSNFKYYKKDEYECYGSCDLIPGIGKNYIISTKTTGEECDCLLYAMEESKKICYNNEEECFNSGKEYKYKLGNQCIKEEQCNFKVKGENNSGYLKKCFNNKGECKTNNYPYYYSTDNGNTGTCWASCPDFVYGITSNQPTEIGGNTCVPECSGSYNYYSTNSKICKQQCDVGEYLNPIVPANNVRECLSSCPSDYIGENNECYSSSTDSCPYNLYIIPKKVDSSKNKCVSKTSCINYGKYYYDNDNTKECIDKCSNNHYYNSNHQCLETCSANNNIKKNNHEIYDYINSDISPKPCLKSTEITNYYYYDISEKKRYYTCDIFKAINSRECSYCNGNNEYVYNSFCWTECPLEAPYFITKSYTFDKTTKVSYSIKSCVPDCSVLNSNYKIIEYSNECVTQCPNTPSNNQHIEYGNKCFIKCQSGYFDPVENKCVNENQCSKYEKSSITDNYICKSSCSAQNKYLDGKKCVDKCPAGKQKVGLNNVCKNNCIENTDGKYYMDIGQSMYKCLFSCPAVEYIFYESGNNECLKECPSTKNFIVKTTENNYECRSECPYDYPYYTKDSNNHNVCSNINPCDNVKPYFYKGSCYQSCTNIPLQYVERNICVSGCTTAKGFNFKNKIENNVFKCKKYCDNNEYVSGDYCYDNCLESGNKFIGKYKNCLSTCNTAVGLYFYPDPSNSNIYKCIESCPPEYPLHIIGEYECFKSCDDSVDKDKLYVSSEENICYYSCLTSPINKFTLEYDNLKKCFYKCDDTTEYKYYYESDLKCLTSCSKNVNHYAYEFTNICTTDSTCDPGYYYYSTTSSNQKNLCVTQCPSDKQYLENNICVNKCQNGTYFVKEFIHGETDIQKRCLNDCPRDYKFYVENNGVKECFSTCDKGYYVNPDSGKIATRCLPDCPNSGYNYKLINGIDKKCVVSCPKEVGEKRFHLPDPGNECLEKCPDYAKFYKDNDFTCYSENDIIQKNICDFIDYSSKKCTSSCMNKNFSKYPGSELKICLDECIPEYGEYLTPFNTCVKDCNGPELSGQHFINDIQNKKCICENFYFYKDLNLMECIPNSVGKKKCKYVHSKYNVNMFNSTECIEKEKCKNNNGILSPSEDTCYDNSYKDKCSSLIDKNSVYKSDLSKCECLYKFYKRDEEQGQQKICLDRNGECPLDYKKYVPQTKECVKDCPFDYNKLFNKLCLNYDVTCSEGNYHWYFSNTNNKYECHEKCQSDDDLEVPISKTSIYCISSCKGSDFPYYYNKKCYTSCANNDLLEIVNAFEVPESPSNNPNYANYICKCLNPWYNDTANNKIICSDSKYPFSISDCKNFTNPQDFKYMVKHTLECIVDDCPSTYPYHFNKECFKDCENDASSFYHYLVPKKDSYECECKNLWFINNQTNKSECIEIDVNECIKFSFYLKYKINETRQCVSECPMDTYSFNYVCYNSCPENTTENATDNTCACNISLGYWYRYEKDNGTNYLRCVLDECPKENNITIKHARKNLVEENSQCLISCSENYKFKYSIRDICREECPYFTDLNEEKDECVFFDLNNENNITNLTLLKDAANVQIKELYEGSEHLGGYLYNRFNASLHFYATDLKNTLTDISFKSNLTYIDLNTCIQKIYDLDNETYLNENHTILIAKYDLITNTLNDNTAPQIINNDKYLINKVEYELFSSNMSEKLIYNSSTCDPYEIIISYPLALNRFNNYIGGLNQNPYRKKFEIGKKLYLRDNNIDTFHFNNTVYKDYCRSLEIDGKDLIFEDRYKYLYPNDKILCESNCIQNNTNFELERIICLCSLKDDFNISRQDDRSIDIFNDPDITLPTQSKYNAEVVKCMFNFSLNETIFYNEAFYYSSIISVAQIAMMFISGFSGVKNAVGNIRHLLSKLNSKKSFGNKKSNSKRIKFKDNNIISTTNRPLNNPPKKDKYKEKYNEDIDFDSDEGEKNNNTILEYDLDSNNDEGVNYEINIKKGVKPDNKDQEIVNDNKNKNSSESKTKGEYIPPEYNFKFFRPKDKGVMKKIERSQIPFEVNPDTVYLIERRKGIEYPEDYLNGPYYPEQNLLIITDDKIKDVKKIAKKLKDEKFMKKNPSQNNNNITVGKINDDNKSELKSQKISVNGKTKTSFYNPKAIGEKSFVTVKKINPDENSNNDENILDELDENNQRKTIDDDTGLLYLIKREHIFLRVNYKSYIKKSHPYYFCVFLAEIFDKIYLFRICFLLRQSDIFSAYFTLYIFCHILLLTLLCNLFTIDIIRKIWERTDFPDLYFYLLYGLISGLIIWIIYLLFSCLINFEDSVRDITKVKYNAENNDDEESDRLYYRKYSCLICQIKFRVSILHIITFLITLCCGVYLVSFFALYTGTKTRVLKIYYISIIEMLLIKVVYGLILASLRIVSKEAKLKILYTIIYILDKYLS